MSAQYKRFLQILEKWPVDKTKAGRYVFSRKMFFFYFVQFDQRFNFPFRDLGEHLREQLKSTLGKSNITTVGSDDLDKQFEALDRLTRNIYADKYPRVYSSTASGLTGAQCNQILSSEFLQFMKEQDKK